MSAPGLAYFTSVDRYLRYDLDPAVDRVADGYPKEIAEGWGGIVDAGFTTGLDAGVDLGAGKLFLFRGDQYVRTTIAAGANMVDPDYPKPIRDNWPGLADHGFGSDLDAVVNTNDGTIWFFKGSLCIRYVLEPAEGTIGDVIAIGDAWTGTSQVGFDGGIDAACSDGGTKVWFFQNDRYIRLEATTRRLDDGFPLPISQTWNGMGDANFIGFIDAAWNLGGAPRDAGQPVPIRDQQWYESQRSLFRQQAYLRAFGGENGLNWDSSLGFVANRDTITRLYDYYGRVYLESDDRCLWAGLGRLAGGAVLSGLGLAVQDGESVITRELVQTGKEIFEDLAWLHEAFRANPADAVALAYLHDRNVPFDSSYGDAWAAIARGGSGIATGNRGLLRNEQLIIVQPHYDLLRDVEPLFGRTRAFTANVHPYHRDFLTAFPQADVTVADDRWAWIEEPGGMLEKWVAMPREERTRLVSLPMGGLIGQDWEPTIQALLPPGSP